MKKSILNLVGAQELPKNEQKAVLGGACLCKGRCPATHYCIGKCGCCPNGQTCL